MLTIRLSRVGKKNLPMYRLIISEKGRDLYGKPLEILGSYNPITKPKQIELKRDRIEYWLSVGAQPSATVNNLLVKEGITKAKKAKSVFISQKRAKKIDAKKATAPAA